MTGTPTVSRRLLVVLGLTVLVAALVMLRGTGGAPRSDVGFDGAPTIALVDDDTEVDDVEWTRPDQPRNPFEPFMEFDPTSALDEGEPTDGETADDGSEGDEGDAPEAERDESP